MMNQKKKQKPLFLYGKNSVLERLRQHPKTILRAIIQRSFDNHEIITLLHQHNIPIFIKPETELQRLARADRLQGIILEISPFTYTPLEQVIAITPSPPSFIMLDGINDPHNLGVIIRLAACIGSYALCIASQGCCPINETVLHVASGGENSVPVTQVESLNETLQQLKKAGYLCLATTVDHGTNPRNLLTSFPLCLMLGAEGRGLSQELVKAADATITIPMPGAQLSLNVAMACSMLLYEFMQQKTNCSRSHL